jgi:hypothetical protein
MPRLQISTKGYHYLDIGFNPLLLNEFLHKQIQDLEVKKLAKKLNKNAKKNESIKTYLRRIQQYIHNDNYHITHDDRLKLFGYLYFDKIPYPKSFILEAFSTLEKAVALLSQKELKEIWAQDKQLSRCIGSCMGTYKKSIKLKNSFRDKVPLQCVEEAVLAAALAFHTTSLTKEEIVFFGSPEHVCVFIRPIDGLKKGCLFDSKMIYFSQNLNKFGTSPEEKKKNYLTKKFGDLWFIVHSTGYIDIRNKKTLSKKEKQIMEELDAFFRV